MLSNPKPGARVRIRYRAGVRERMPWHDRVGRIAIVCKARRCRNHGVEVDGRIVAIPAGNLNAEK